MISFERPADLQEAADKARFSAGEKALGFVLLRLCICNAMSGI